MAVADAPFDLLDVKLAAPAVRPDTVAKADLIARLCASSEPVVTVVAGAGYGKTTLLARWAAADPRSFAWVSLDGREDEVVLLRYVAAAIHRVEPVPEVVIEALSGPRGSIWSRRVPQLVSALAALERPMVLVLDDLHAVSRPSCIDVLAALLEYVPAGSQVAIASREEPALPLARWRAQGRVQEIGVTELRLDDHEAGQLLKAAGTELDADALTELTEHTEGWPAGLYLAALSQRAGANPTGIMDVAGDDRFVSDYFRLELLSRLPPEQARFLKQTSVLERMCGALCDAVLETAGSANELERLGRTNCFVVPLDRKGEWYRYHHLFGELLRTELGRSDPGVVASLSGRAMAWCISNDLPEEAIEYAHAAGEMDTLAGLLDTLTLSLHYDGRTETVDEWLRWFTDEDLVRYPALAVYGAWIRALTGRPADAERWLALADGATSTIALSDGSATIKPWIATLRAHMMRDGVEQALADAELALDQLPAESPWIPTARLARGVAHSMLEATELATEDLTATIEKGVTLGSVEEIYLAHALLALLDAKTGAWGQAGVRARAAQAVVDEAGLGELSSSAVAHVATARVAQHEGRQADARAALTRAHRLRPLLDHAIPWVSVMVGLELTRVHLALAEAGAANTVLAEAEGVLELRPLAGSLAADARELRARVAATTESAGAWAMTLTGAELRLLPYLATHLSFPEVASRLYISRNTVKTEAVSIYRKLGAASRSEAVERAVQVGLLESSIYPPQANFTL